VRYSPRAFRCRASRVANSPITPAAATGKPGPTSARSAVGVFQWLLIALLMLPWSAVWLAVVWYGLLTLGR